MSAWGTPPGMSRNYREARPRVMLRGDDHNSTKFQRTTGQYRGQDNMAPGTDHLHAGAPPLGQANYRGDTALRPHNEMMSHGVPRPYPQMPRVADGLGPSQPPYIVGDGVTDVVMGDHHRSIHAVRGEDASSAPPGGFHSAAPTVFDSNWMQRQLQQPQQPSAASLGKRIRKRCSNFPNCRFGDSCRYIHPSEMCKSWPHCQYGVECFYIHPEVDCKFAVNCYNWYCNYKHPSEWSPSFPGANYLGAGGMNSRMVASMLTGAPNKFGTVNRFQVFKNKTLRETEFEESRTSMTDDGAHKQQPLQAPPTTDAAVPEKSEEYSDRINLSKKDDVEVA
eukprot:Lankesteria_metandrocarpae@DN4333_c0_g1_i1.p1